MDNLFSAMENFRSAQKAEEKTEFIAAKTEGMAQRLDRLERIVARLVPLNRAIWEILSEAANVTEKDLKERLRQMAAEQSAANRPGTPAPPCPKCGRPLERGRDICMYCGTKHEVGSVFDLLL